MTDPGHEAFCQRVVDAIFDSERTPVIHPEILRHVVHETILGYCGQDPQRYREIERAGRSNEPLNADLASRLRRIAWDHVLPEIFPDITAHSRFGWRHRIFLAEIDPRTLMVGKGDALRWVLYESIRRYLDQYPRRKERLVRVITSKARLNGLGDDLKRIAWDEVIPGLSEAERANLRRSLRYRRRPHITRPPAEPRKIRNLRGPGR